MSYAYNASSCPAIQIGSSGTLLLISGAGGTSGNSPTGKNMVARDIYFRENAINPNLTAQALHARYGTGGAYCVCVGLILSVSSGLTLAISAGHALIDGVVEVPAAQTLAIGPSVTAYIWLSNQGAITYTTTTTPPTGAQSFLGTVVTSGSAITGIDFSGVLYCMGPMLKRFTADAGVPTDTPPASLVFQTQTAFGLFEWTGTRYVQRDLPVVTADPTSRFSGMTWIRSDMSGQQSFDVGGTVKRTAAPS